MPFFLCIDGPDGVGKTTLLDDLALKCMKSYEVVALREPGGTPVGERIREILKSEKLSNEVQLHLIKAQRALLYEMIPEYTKGADIVLADRGVIATWAYQQSLYNGDVNRFFDENPLPFKWDAIFIYTHRFEDANKVGDHYDKIPTSDLTPYYTNPEILSHYFDYVGIEDQPSSVSERVDTIFQYIEYRLAMVRQCSVSKHSTDCTCGGSD